MHILFALTHVGTCACIHKKAHFVQARMHCMDTRNLVWLVCAPEPEVQDMTSTSSEDGRLTLKDLHPARFKI